MIDKASSEKNKIQVYITTNTINVIKSPWNQDGYIS